MSISRRVSKRPIEEKRLLQAVNKEIVPAIDKLIEHANATDFSALELRVDALETTTADHETRIDATETLLVTHESRLDTLESDLAALELRVDALETTAADHETRIDALEAGLLVPEEISGTTYTLVLADAGKLKYTTNGSSITITVPTNASVAFPVGTQVHFEQNGAGVFTLSGASPPTLNARVGLSSAGQYAALTITKKATDTWLVTGDMA